MIATVDLFVGSNFDYTAKPLRDERLLELSSISDVTWETAYPSLVRSSPKLIQDQKTSSRNQWRTMSQKRFVKTSQTLTSQTRSTRQVSRSNHQKVDPHRQGYRIRQNWSRLLGKRTMTRHVITGGIHASSSRSTSKQLRLQYNLFRHQHQQEQNRETVLVRSLMWQANHNSEYTAKSTEERDVRFEAKRRREDLQEGRSIWSRRGETKNRESQSSKKQFKKIEILQERRKRHFEKEKVLKDKCSNNLPTFVQFRICVKLVIRRNFVAATPSNSEFLFATHTRFQHTKI